MRLVAVDVDGPPLAPDGGRGFPSEGTPWPCAVQSLAHALGLGGERVRFEHADVVEPRAVLAVLPLELRVVLRMARQAVLVVTDYR